MTEITVKVNTRELTRQLNDLDLLQYQFKPNELGEFIKENLKVVGLVVRKISAFIYLWKKWRV